MFLVLVSAISARDLHSIRSAYHHAKAFGND